MGCDVHTVPIDPVTYIYTAMRTGCKKARVDYYRFKKDGLILHDLRYTFNTNMRKGRVPESVIMEITGHSTREMLDRHNTVKEEDTRRAIDQFQDYLKGVGQNVDQHAVDRGKTQQRQQVTI